MISYIIPYTNNRYDLIVENFKSLNAQTSKDFEVIVVCQNCFEDFKDVDINFELKTVLISCYGQNPATSQNEGVRHAEGSVLVLTSPEVVNAKTNVEELVKLPKNTFWLGRVVEEHKEHLDPDNFEYGYIARQNGIQGMMTANCVKETWASWKYFLGAIHKEDYLRIGGMDEEFMKGIAWEDRDFADRIKANGIVSEFNPKIAGIHLYHPRTYQHNNEDLRMINRRYYQSKSMVTV